ncbi:MAG: ACT domain-containing protein, partial [Proteobacteria bacterium]|nr:ACT domain-containing protein [Pseudomonadota bacterium]
LSLILEQEVADRGGLSYASVFRAITLTVHSSLDAIGLTAAVAGKLAEHGISANVVAASYHDHIFVPRDKAEQALKLLAALSR